MPDLAAPAASLPLAEAAPTARLPPAEDHPLRIVIVGHVDHGKSTLVGRLLHDMGAMAEGKVAAIRAMSERRGMPFEWAFLMDAIQAERDQGITIDTTQIRFASKKRPYLVIDAPGHKEFLKNMVTGAASAEAALLLVDAAEGVQEQTRRHAYLLQLLGLQQVAVLVNKMDLVGYAEARFQEVADATAAHLAGLGITAQAILPIAAREGANITGRSAAMPWWTGPTVVEALDGLTATAPLDDLPLRLPVQDVYKFDERRIVAGRIESGRLAVGDTVLFSPSNKTARVRSLEAWSVAAPPTVAGAGESVGITLYEPIFVERGEVMSHVTAPPVESNVFRAKVFWLGRESLAVGTALTLKHGTSETPVIVEAIERALDTGSLASTEAADAIPRGGAGEIVLRARPLLALDEHTANPATGRFVLVDDYRPVGGGLISMRGYADQRDLVTVKATNITAVGHTVTAEARVARNGHKGGTLWFTGLSGAGKSTLALALEQALFTRGFQVYVLDGDNVRTGLNANLGFSPEDRAENIRRVGEVAALFADAGFIVISSFISPYRSDRERARAAAKRDFHEIWVKADLAACEARDPKGLYRRARAGEIKDFTGISSPYEAPETPDLVVNTDTDDVAGCLACLLDYVDAHFKVVARG